MDSRVEWPPKQPKAKSNLNQTFWICQMWKFCCQAAANLSAITTHECFPQNQLQHLEVSTFEKASWPESHQPSQHDFLHERQNRAMTGLRYHKISIKLWKIHDAFFVIKCWPTYFCLFLLLATNDFSWYLGLQLWSDHKLWRNCVDLRESGENSWTEILSGLNSH